MSQASEQVTEFHHTFGHPVHTGEPSLHADSLSPERRTMRMNLIAEEFSELVRAVYGDAAQYELDQALHSISEHHLDESNNDVVETADALGDLTYVIHGFALEAGIPLDDVIGEIHASNMSKLGDDGQPIYRDDGKVLKGNNYFRPDVATVLHAHE